jgi:hypothetical protein
MNSYRVYFHSDLQWARRDIEAKTPKQALAEAKRFAEERFHELDLDYFAPFDNPINEIQVCDDGNDNLAEWLDDGLRLRLSAPELLAAADLVVARWERGDLAGAVRDLAAAISKVKGGD